MTLLLLFSLLPLIGATHHLHSLPTVQLDPNDFAHADALVYTFPSTKPSRCLLQTESKHFHLDASCQLLTRTSLKHVCPLNYTLKLEVVLPHNTTIYQLIIALKYSKALPATVSSDQSTVTLPFSCNGKNQHSVRRSQKELIVGNARFILNKPADEQQLCQFESNPYRVKLRENELYQNFLQLKTIASCSTTPNYLLASSNAKRNFEYFRLDSSTGFLSLTHSLDYESSTTWKLVIQGHDQSRIPFYTYVIIEVEDINDCLPLLSWNFPLQTIELINDTDSFNIEIGVLESKLEQPNVVIANLIASDLDALPFNFELRVNASQFVPFQIHGPFADSTFVLSTSQQLDREQQDKYVLDLVLTDNGQPKLFSSYRLVVHILDDNDNAPTFDKSVYYVDIQENNPVNTVLLQVHANDADENENGRVTYELSDSYNNYVTIDSQTGVIRTKMQFDYEQLTNLTFNVTAVDRPKKGQPLKSSAVVNVKIVDQNDNVPKFAQPTYEFSMYENNAPHSFVGQIIAHDIDHSPLVYTLDNPSPQISSHFQIAASDGKIYALNPLDREQFSQYVFYVTASDGQHKSPRVKVHINVLDLNDEIPRFTFPNDNNDTLIIDRTYWRTTDFICQIDIQDHDQIPNHTLTLLDNLDQLKNYDYLSEQKPSLQFDSSKFFLDNQGKLYFNASNGTTLNEGVYYLAFKIIDGANYFDEKLLKLIVVNNYERVQTIVKLYDHLGSHLNNRFSYLQYRSNHHNNPHHHQQYSQRSRQSSSLDESSKFLVFIVITVLSIILIGITFIFISLIRRKSLQQKELLRKQDSLSTSSALQHQSESSTTTLFKPPSLNGSDKRQSLRVSNCYEYNDLSSSPSLLMLNKDSMLPPAIMNDNCCLLEKLSEKEIYEDPRNKTYSSWILSTSGRPESRYSQRSADSSTFHSLNRLSIPSQNLSQQLCSPKRHSTMTYESTVTTSTTNSSAQAASTPSDYAVAIVSASSTNNSPHTPVSSDDGFCGSSDISDPPGTVGSMSLLASHAHHSYRQPYAMMKEGIMHKSAHSPSYGTLLNRFNDPATATDSTRRVRFNLDPDDKHQQRTILPLPTSNSPGRLADHALRRFEQLYMSRDAVLDKQSLDSTILYTNSTVV